MNVQFVFAQDTTSAPAGETTAYDSIWAAGNPSTHPQSAFERMMLSEDKLYVVLGVVLIIWIGILFFITRTDRKLARLERTIKEGLPEESL